ncbi:unnamed protein product (macronuclear) [Paramecium tetraurelia]|uniref:Uncharacterized protein n=1 Tax=Paramecium tetraurelia TaxID=5888 RepID=A0DIB3_PARTE|nr:uncharacterized protein GSPATT00017152001 [Paramecium tetraurelia]CAK82780.1 unnamed protein product [Paramecium tetraurelia]|eukprot:XP_001450177.1 hypothetical protein (macronuclear) [Paramecium tetraurelia strain d4-2]
MPYSLVAVHDKIYLIFGDTLLLIQPEINKKTFLIEQPLTAFCVSDHTNPRIVGVNEGEITLWRTSNLGKPNLQEPTFNNFAPKSKELIELQKILSDKLDECDDLLMLQNGLVFAKQKKVGEVFLVDFENDVLEELQTTYGCAVTCWTPISYDSIAFASNGQIVLTKFLKNKQAVVQIVLSSSKDDIHHGLCYSNNHLFSINKSAVVTSWNIQTGTKIKTAEVKFCPGVYSLQLMNPEIIVAEHKDKKDFILLNNNLEKQFFYKAQSQIVRMENLLHSSKNVDCFMMKRSYFTLRLKSIPLTTNWNLKEEKKLITWKSRQSCSQTIQPIQYILKISKSVNPILVKWNYLNNEYNEEEMLVEKYKTCQLYFNRSVFSYDFKPAPSQQFNLFGPKRTDDSNLITGISVYDENIKRLLKVQFQQQFNADVFGMPCQNLLYVLNNKNQIEVWDINTQQQVQKADCRPSVVKQMKFSEQYLFLNAQSEWIIRDLKLSQICKTKGELINKCLFLNQKCIINQKQNLFEWDLSSNQCKQIPIFKVYDFCLVQNKILVIGESTIKLLTL